MDETGKLGDKLRIILDELFAGDEVRKVKAHNTREINEKAAKKRAEIDQAQEALKAAEAERNKKQKQEVKTFAANAGITEKQAEWIKSFQTAKH